MARQVDPRKDMRSEPSEFRDKLDPSRRSNDEAGRAQDPLRCAVYTRVSTNSGLEHSGRATKNRRRAGRRRRRRGHPGSICGPMRSSVTPSAWTKLPLAPDLAVIATPPPTVPEIVASLGARGTRAVIVVTRLRRRGQREGPTSSKDARGRETSPRAHSWPELP